MPISVPATCFFFTCFSLPQLLLPTDVVIADKFDPEANAKTVKADAIPDGWMVSGWGRVE